MPSQTEIRRQITQEIVRALEKGGIPPWRQGWTSHPNGNGLPRNAATNRKYNGINILLLQLHAARLGLTSKFYGTFHQWKQLGCSVKARPTGVEPGRWGAQIVFFKPIERTQIDEETGDLKEKTFPIMKQFTGFSADQVEGAEKWRVPSVTNADNFPDFEPAEATIAATGADIKFGGSRAFYIPSLDYIQCPPKADFVDVKEYYGTIFHELAHWSESRVGWKAEYALSELRAEIAAAFLSAELGVPQSDDLTNVKAYLNGWLKVLRDDPKYIFTASAAASKAANHILSYGKQVAEIEEIDGALVV